MPNPMMKRNRKQGFTSAELLLVLALGAMVIGGAVVSFGTLVRNQPRVSSVVEADLGSSRLVAWYGSGYSGTKKTVNSAPNYGSLALAERLREQFNTDIISATAVYCLTRDSNTSNTYHPTSIPYNPATDEILDTSVKFRDHLQAKGLPYSLFGSDRNFSSSKSNATIFILGYSKVVGEISVIATYDIDVVKVLKPDGFYASVRRYVGAPVLNVNEPQGYEIFYPPFPELYNSTAWPNANGTTDGFTPLFVAFERSARTAVSETTSTDRFKKAAERPFYFVWWPDPGARDLRKQPNSYPSTDPRAAYNHQGGRTSFMFTVPMFPSL